MPETAVWAELRRPGPFSGVRHQPRRVMSAGSPITEIPIVFSKSGVINRETIMTKLSLFAASISTAMVCVAVPVSLKWSPDNVRLFSLDTAEARVGRPLTATSVAGVHRRVQRRTYRRAAVAGGVVAGGVVAGGAALWSCRCWHVCRGTCPGLLLRARSCGRRAGLCLWLRPRTLPGLCNREPCHGKVVHD